MTKVVAIGECMLELSALPNQTGWRLAHAGDTYNTALYLARLGLDVSYMTALGADQFSREMRQSWLDEGIDTSLVLTAPDHLPGLYAIRTDRFGERSFAYWRNDSAARQLFACPEADAALAAAASADLLYLSGITLSLFDRPARERLSTLAAGVRARGGTVAFDPNYRARGWVSRAAARDAISAFGRHVSIAMPTYDDELELWGDRSDADTARRWHALGVDELVVKLGSEGCLIITGDQKQAVPPGAQITPIDTTGAGDAFNAGFLAAQACGKSAVEAAHAANRLAGTVIGYPGAIIPRTAMPEP